MSGLLEHFKPPPLASDPPEKTRYFPAPPKGGAGGILQRTPESSSSTCPSPISRVSFAPLPDLTPRKRRNSITLGVAARSATLRRNREAGPQPQPQPQQPGPGRQQANGRNGQYTYPGPPRPRARRVGNGHYKDDQVVDLGEVAMDAGKKLWRAINSKSRKPSTASDSGRPTVESHSVGGPTVGAIGHNTEREISVRGFAVPDEDLDEDDEETETEAQHRTEDYVAGIQAMHISDSIEVHPTRLSPPPLLPEGSDATSSSVSTPSQEQEPLPEAPKDTLF